MEKQHKKNILILNGPNLNLLGMREPDQYGATTLKDIEHRLEDIAARTGEANLLFFQSNAEHQLIDRLHQAHLESIDFIIFNPAAFTHTSIALRDAMLAVAIPFIEVHLSNIYARDSFRHHSYFSDIAKGVICGLGSYGYEAALLTALCLLNKRPLLLPQLTEA